MFRVAMGTAAMAVLFSVSISLAAAESFTPPKGKLWVTVASSLDLDEVIGIARLFHGEARVVRAQNGWYATTLEPRAGSLDDIRSDVWPQIPDDAILSSGKTYVGTEWRLETEPGVKAMVTKDKPGDVRAGNFEVKLTRERRSEGWTAHVVGTENGNVNFAIQASITGSFLEAKGVAYETGAPGDVLKGADLAEQAQSVAAAIECRP